MKIDILLITYNQEQYIHQAIDGILHQRVKPDVSVRIIVADDCSRDHTYEIIKDVLGERVMLSDDMVADVLYLPRESNMGHQRNYQRAFKACDSDYVAIIEGDDYWNQEDHLQTHLDFLEKHTECVLSLQRPIWYFEEEDRCDTMFLDETLSSGMHQDITIEDEIHVNRVENLSSCVIRTEALQSLDPRVFECSVMDWPMYVNLQQKGIFCVLPGSSSIYRIKSSGLYAGLDSDGQKRKDLQLIDEIERIFPQYAQYYKGARQLLQPKKKSLKRRLKEAILFWK